MSICERSSGSEDLALGPVSGCEYGQAVNPDVRGWAVMTARLGVLMGVGEVSASRMAVIDVDLQCCFVENSPLAAPDGLAVLAAVNRLTAAARSAGCVVVHTRMLLRPDGADVGVMAQRIPPSVRTLYTDGAPTADLHPNLDVDESDIVLGKARYGAFHATELEYLLRSRDIDTVVIAGIQTNICCETTAREAAQRDFRVLFVADATATNDMNGLSADDLQAATLASLSAVFADVVTTDEAIELLSSSVSARV